MRNSRLLPLVARLLLASSLWPLASSLLRGAGEQQPLSSLLGDRIAAVAAESGTRPSRAGAHVQAAGSGLPTGGPAEAVGSLPAAPVDSTQHDPEAREIARLERLPAVTIPIQDESLAGAITIIATASGMNFIAPGPDAFPERLTLTTEVSPWRLLHRLADRYRFTLGYRDGIWEFNREAEGALVARVYVLKHTNLDVYKTSQNAFSSLESLSGTGPASTGPADGGLVFSAQTQKIIDDIRELIGLHGVGVGSAPGGTKDEAAAAPTRSQGPDASGPSRAAAGAPRTGKVIYVPDANALYVACTRAQHDLVAGYLQVVDRPPRQIYVEARFFETAWEPKTILGLNPQNLQPRVGLSGITAQVDLSRPSASWERAVLSVDDLSVQMNALQTDTRSRLIQNPSVVTTNNREVYFSVGDEEPFVSSNNIYPGVPNGGFGATTASISIRRIGTSVNVVPTLFAGDHGKPRIRLVVRIEIGALKGFREINAISVPVVSSQKYEYTTYVDDNQALAFGGLTGLGETRGVTKVPLAGDLPVVGYLFKSKSRELHQRNLVAYIIARVVDPSEPVVLPPVPRPGAAATGAVPD